MSVRPKDPLLAIARLLSWFFIVFLSLGAAFIVLGILLVAFNHPQVVAELAQDGIAATPVMRGSLALLLSGILLLILLTIWFLRLLLRIIDTVGHGDPFIPQNARRLNQMAWLSLATFLVSLPIGALAIWVGKMMSDASEDWDFDLSDALLLSIILFILARVFKQGAAMREDLEGTV